MKVSVARPASGSRSRAIRVVAAAACAALSGLMASSGSADIAGFTQVGTGPDQYTINRNAAGVTGGVPSITSGILKLTTNTNDNATSIFYNTPQDITNFTASFLYDVGLSTAIPADGFTMVFHNDSRGNTALGGSGAGLGYSGIGSIGNSVAIGYDIYNGGGSATRTGAPTNGGFPSYVNTTSVNLRNYPVRVNIAYRDGVINPTLTDTVTNATSFQTFYRTIPFYTGSNTAIVGFTGGTGGFNAEQFISEFTYTVGNAPPRTQKGRCRWTQIRMHRWGPCPSLAGR